MRTRFTVLRLIAPMLACWPASGCIEYRHPIIETDGSPQATSPVGIVQFMAEHPQLHYRLIAVHGIGDQTPTFADSWISSFAQAAKLSSPQSSEPAPYDMGETKNHRPVPQQPQDMRPYMKSYVLKGTGASSGLDMRAYAVNWSPLTRPYKKELVADETPLQYKRSRAAINGLIKFDLLDDRLVDAVMYAGAYKATLRQAISDALCRVCGAPLLMGFIRSSGAVTTSPERCGDCLVAST